ncbi:MAG: indole-3-glycerol phosphate synthase TrpC, partial [Acidimicrobiia bacterium]|nr:indole-3-glycerol phosphate synthase TrpC [Acidimicrobiia bacterium]
MVSAYLQPIVDAHRAEAAEDQRPTDTLIEQARGLPPCRGFRDALASVEGLGVIAEIKRRSPSKGDLAIELDPATVASAYADGGATCLSVLTDGPHFGGSTDDLALARAAVGLPVLRKDFTVAPNDVVDARLMGADAVLLIVAALDDVELADFATLAAELGLDVLVEVHDEAELERAVGGGATVIGVNQRDLATFEVDTERAVRLAPAIPPSVLRVAESGVQGPADADELFRAGFQAVLV